MPDIVYFVTKVAGRTFMHKEFLIINKSEIHQDSCFEMSMLNYFSCSFNKDKRHEICILQRTTTYYNIGLGDMAKKLSR